MLLLDIFAFTDIRAAQQYHAGSLYPVKTLVCIVIDWQDEYTSVRWGGVNDVRNYFNQHYHDLHETFKGKCKLLPLDGISK